MLFLAGRRERGPLSTAITGDVCEAFGRENFRIDTFALASMARRFLRLLSSIPKLNPITRTLPPPTD